MTDRHVLVVGPGWLGAPLATSLAHSGPDGGTDAAATGGATRVWTLSRSGTGVPAGCTGIAGDITSEADLPEIMRQLPAAVHHVIVCVAPSAARGDSYQLYPAAARGAAALARAYQVASVLYISSTGIYDRQDGSVVDEQTPITATSDRVRALAQAEQLMAAAAQGGTSVCILRAAGLYGPGRDPAKRFGAGLVPADTWCNFSWRDDVIRACAHLLSHAPSHGAHTYNCTDGTPLQAGRITQALTGAWPTTPPTPAHAGDASPGRVMAGRSNQRIMATALRETGWLPSMPTVFDGLRQLGHALPGLAWQPT